MSYTKKPISVPIVKHDLSALNPTYSALSLILLSLAALCIAYVSLLLFVVIFVVFFWCLLSFQPRTGNDVMYYVMGCEGGRRKTLSPLFSDVGAGIFPPMSEKKKEGGRRAHTKEKEEEENFPYPFLTLNKVYIFIYKSFSPF